MSTIQRRFAASLSVLVLILGGSWLFLGGKGLVDETRGLQASLLAGEITGRDRSAGVVQVIRNIDKMDREDVKKVRDAFIADWRQLKRQAIDEYHAASETERKSLLDREIARLVTAGELWFATNPRSNGQPPKRRKPKIGADNAAKAKQSGGEQRIDQYRVALLGRAKTRGIAVPEWLLDAPTR